MAAFRLLFCCVLLFLPHISFSIPESGKMKMKFVKDGEYRGFSKALYKDATIRASGTCKSKSEKKPSITISWKLKFSQCADVFFVEPKNIINFWDLKRNHEMSGEDTVQCNGQIHLTDKSRQKEYIEPPTEKQNTSKMVTTTELDHHASEEESNKNQNDQKRTKRNHQRRSRRAEDNQQDNEASDDEPIGISSEASSTSVTLKTTNAKAPVKTVKTSSPTDQSLNSHPDKKKNDTNRITTTKHDGIYILIVKITTDNDDEFDLELDISMESKSGYLSATDWPLLPFYGVMSLLYLFYGIVWLIVSACQWRDLLRIQFWIGGVIALGMLEKAVFYSEYNNINNTGVTTPSLVVFAEVVSVAKRTLARMLVIIVSMGFGIVKPRLGKSLHRVLGVGALYFVLGVVEGSMRSLSLKADPSKEQLVAGIPLAVLDAAICWWIFMSLVQTTRTLRIRRNIVKLSLYRHFTNTLIFAVLASVAYMVWSIKTHRFADCLKDWSELWLDEAFWHFLFSILLLVIMVLWRPTANNQRYAFTPIVDFDDDDEEDNVTLSEAFDGMKMRNTRTEVVVNGTDKRKAEDDLKWVEENIPSSAADTVLPSVLDSDEELMTTKFEMSKMD